MRRVLQIWIGIVVILVAYAGSYLLLVKIGRIQCSGHWVGIAQYRLTSSPGSLPLHAFYEPVNWIDQEFLRPSLWSGTYSFPKTSVTYSKSTLTTPSFKITIAAHCPEGCVTCDDVDFTSIDRTSGKTLTLTGQTNHTMGPDGVTPTHFLGYLFKDGATQYFVGDDGRLEIKQGEKVLMQESGKWTDR